MNRTISRSDWSSLIFLLAVAFGAFVRFNLTLLAGFPINDGGMFAVMVDDLRANQYLIPAFTSYNHFNIPFAYPPLGFYFGALTVDLFNVNSVEALRWVPSFFASLSIPAFYLVARRLLKDMYLASLSTLFFALMPRAFSWFVMGGGLTRSPGQFFMLLTLFFVLRLYEENRRTDIFWAGLFGGFAVMSHPEAAVHTVVSAVFFWLVRSRKRESFFNSIGVGVLVFLFTIPWWGTVLYYHGVEPLFNATQTGQNPLAVFHLLFFVFTQETYATVIAVLGLIGIASRLAKRDFMLVIWMVLPFLVEGRSAPGPAAIPLAMLAAIGLGEVLVPAIQAWGRKDADESHLISKVERNIFIYLMLYLLFSAYQFGFQLSAATLYSEDQKAMQWVKENTPADSRFLVLTGTNAVSCDSVLEWFPALTGRQSLYTVQGTEWTKGDEFSSFIRETNALQACYDESPACVANLLKPDQYDYVYLSRTLRVNNCQYVNPIKTFKYYEEGVRTNADLDIVYETDGVLIYKNR